MKISPMPQGGIQQPSSSASDARSNAIAALMGNQPAPVNQNNISPEEMPAVSVQESEEVEQPVEMQSEEVQPVEEVKSEPVKSEKDQLLSKQFAQLARQEKALRAKMLQQEQSFKAREEALKLKEQELLSKGQTDLSNYVSKDMFKKDPLLVLNELGMSYDQLAEQMLNQPQRNPVLESQIAKLEARIQQLQEEGEKSKKSAIEQQQQQYQAAVKQIEMDAKRLVQSDPSFETIRATNSVKDVVELITETYNKEGVLLSVEEAAQQVEDYLLEETEKLFKINKIKERISKAQAQAKPVQKQTPTPQSQPKPQPQQMKTLTNANSSSRQLSARERAILAMKGELKS